MRKPPDYLNEEEVNQVFDLATKDLSGLEMIKINFLPEWIIAILTAVLAFATIAYVILIYKSLKSAEKDRKRPQVVELIKRILTPFINKLSEHERLLENEDYTWNHRKEKMENINLLDVDGEKKTVLRDLKRENPHIKRMIDEHNEIYSILENKLKSLDKAMYTQAFEKECHNFVKEYNKQSDVDVSITDAPPCLIDYVINNKRKLGTNEYYKFWKEYGSKLLQIRERYKNQIMEVEENGRELIKVSKRLKIELERQKEKYRKKYNLLIEEFHEKGSEIIV